MHGDDQHSTGDGNRGGTSRGGRIGLYGFILALLSVLTCGITALPGFACSVIGIRRRSCRGLSWLGVIFSLIWGLMILGDVWPQGVPLPRPYADFVLLTHGEPALPVRARRVYFHTGSTFFDRWVYIRFSAPASEVARYVERLGARPTVPIGTRARGDAYLPEEKAGTAPRPVALFPCEGEWFRPDRIRCGVEYPGRGSRPGSTRWFSIYWDQEADTVYYYSSC